MFRFIIAAFLLAAGLTVGAVNTTQSGRVPTPNAVDNLYIISLESQPLAKDNVSSAHAQLYRKLKSRDVRWTTVKEYHDPILTGAVLKLSGPDDLAILTEEVGAESINPVYVQLTQKATTSNRHHVLKRSEDKETPYWIKVTGIDKLHTAGFRGEGVTIGLVDSGIDYTHSLLGGGFGPGHKVRGGYDFVGDDFTGQLKSIPQPSNDPLDQCFGHGTNVAGILIADPNPQQGVLGVAYKANINAYRVAGCGGETRTDVIIDGLLRAHQDGNNLILLTVSFLEHSGQTVLAKVLNEIAASGRVIVVAAGNMGQFGFWLMAFARYDPGVIIVGSARIPSDHSAPSTSRGMIIDSNSQYGPTSNMGLGVTLVGPGDDIATTDFEGYAYVTGTSASAPIVAGSIALWLQIYGTSEQTPSAIRAVFQSTACPLRQQPGAKSLDTVAHQGAGLIQTYHAISGMSSIYPTELLLNDTMFGRWTWPIRIHNSGDTPVSYRLSHQPAGTASTIKGTKVVARDIELMQNSATIYISPSKLTVPAYSTKPIYLRIDPPVGLDGTTFPVYSGYILAIGSDRSVLRTLYIGLAASMKNMKIFDTHAVGFGSIPTVLDGQRNPIHGPTTYTMRGDDVPKILFRLVNSSPLVRLRLRSIKARVSRRPADRFRPPRGIFQRICDKCPFRKHTRNPNLRSMTPGSKKPSLVGELSNVWRSVSPNGRREDRIGVQKITKFFDGSDIPDGDYRLVLSGLKNYGNKRKRADWETWTSPIIQIRRQRVQEMQLPENSGTSGGLES